MAYYGAKPIKVADGGTGQVTLTNHGVLLGQGTSPIVAVSPGNDGTLLAGVTGADPVFSTNCPGTFFFAVSSAGVPLVLTVANTDNTNTASNSATIASTGGPAGGDPRHQYVISVGSVNNYSWIVSNAATSPEDDPFQHVMGTTAGAQLNIVMQKSGLITKPRDTCFLAYLPTQVNNVTGAGGVYTLGVSGITAVTKVFDQNSNLTTGGVFTAPSTGLYDIRVVIRVIASASSKVFTINLITSNRTYQFTHNDASLSGPESISVEAICDFDLGDTATATCVVTGEVGNTDGIAGTGTPVLTYICGRLVA